jgi:DHA2 family multidrug resistance protein
MSASASADAPWTPAYSAAGSRNPWLITVILSLATFMEVLDTSVANISLRHIGGDLSATYDEATWTLTSYLVANAIIVPLSGWLSDVLGRKRYYMISVAIFTLSSLACAFAPSLTWLIVARVVQGLGGGGLAPCEQSMLIDTFPPEKRGRAISAYGLVLILGPALGPTLGGLITDAASWRWIFLINVPIGLISLALVGSLVAEPLALRLRRARFRRSGARADLLGFSLVALGLGCLQAVIDRGQQADWFSSPAICAGTAVAVICLVFLSVWERRCANPILNLRLFGDLRFVSACVLMASTGAVIYATTQMAPQFAQQVLGYTALWAGLAMMAGSAATLIMTGLTALLIRRTPVWLMMLAGVAMEVAGLLAATRLSDQDSFWTISFIRVWLVAGLPPILVPLTTGTYARLSPKDTGQASAFLNLFRNIGGGAGIATAQTLLARRTPVHWSHLAGLMSPSRWSLAQGRSAGTIAPLFTGDAWTSGRADLLAVHWLQTRALLEAYRDVFWTLGMGFACVAPLVFLLRPRRRANL